MIKEIKTRKDASGNNSTPAGWDTRIEDLDARAHIWIEALWDDIQSVYLQPGTGSAMRQERVDAWMANPHLVRWLGGDKVTNQQIINVRRRIRKIKKKLDDGLTYIIIKEQSGKNSWACNDSSASTTVAYVTGPLYGDKIHLCPRWFSHTDTDYVTSVIIHEIVHKLGLFGKSHHGAKNENDALNLAIEHPIEARKSPENYEHLIKEYA